MEKNGLVNGHKKTDKCFSYERVADGLYLMILIFLGVICAGFFYRQTVMYGGKYVSDTILYMNMVKDGIREPRAINQIFHFLYSEHTGTFLIAIYMSMVIIGTILANFLLISYLIKRAGIHTVHRRTLQLFSLIILFSGPIYLLVIYEHVYEGTWSKFAWHSPTQQLMTLFGLLSIFLFFKIYDQYFEYIGIIQWIGLAGGLLIATWAKPSFVMVFGPVMAILLLKDLIQQKIGFSFWERFKRVFIFGSTVIPTGIYILLLYRVIYTGEESSDSIAIRFGYFFLQAEEPFKMVLLSLLFPIIVLLTNLKKLRCFPYAAAWGTFFFGVTEYLLFIEEGARISAGNFGWGQMFSIYFLFIVSFAIFIENYKDPSFFQGRKNVRSLYFILSGMCVALHVAPQIGYFIFLIQGGNYYI